MRSDSATSNVLHTHRHRHQRHRTSASHPSRGPPAAPHTPPAHAARTRSLDRDPATALRGADAARAATTPAATQELPLPAHGGWAWVSGGGDMTQRITPCAPPSHTGCAQGMYSVQQRKQRPALSKRGRGLKGVRGSGGSEPGPYPPQVKGDGTQEQIQDPNRVRKTPRILGTTALSLTTTPAIKRAPADGAESAGRVRLDHAL